jgi:catechol 2,3-dioxygenase-like lactoylglutathione lyase family enzyme
MFILQASSAVKSLRDSGDFSKLVYPNIAGFTGRKKEGGTVLLEGLHHISQGCSDLKRSIEFYTDVLDFEVVEESDSYALLHLDPIKIRLNHIEGHRSKIENPGESSLAFIMDVDDFTEALTELEEQGIEIIKGPVMIEGGESILISDPDGNLIELFYREE